MKKQVLFLAVLLSFGQIIAQKKSVWHKMSTNVTSKIVRIQQNEITEGEIYFSLDANAFKQPLVNANSKLSTLPGVVVEFPNTNGEIEKFQVWENSNMTPDFQAMFPEIRAYVGKGITTPGATINFSVSPQGIQTILFRPDGGTEFIEAFDKAATLYVVYDSKNRVKKPFNCTTPNEQLELELLNNSSTFSRSSAGSYKTMRLALSCTAEYSNYFGATSSANVSLVIAAMNATMTRVNGVMEKDLALHLNMINNTNIIYYDPATDPYSDGTAGSGGAWNGELQANLTSVVTAANYDIGHLFGASGGGGNAGCIGCVCNAQKGSAYTSPSNNVPAGDYFDIDYVVHEMGHQLGGNHSFTHSTEGTIAQTEPGSGSTIMGYAGITDFNVQAHSDPIFSYKGILQIQTNLNNKTCPVSTPLNGVNATPVVNAGLNYTIPIGTAFMLTGTATDADASDVLTYLWEQNDVGTSSTTDTNSRVLQTKTAGPNWRTFKPSTNNFRYFPQMGKILSGTIAIATAGLTNWESVSTVARTLKFTFTARDNHAGMGQTATDETTITVNTSGVAFSVSSQNVNGLSFPGLSQQTVSWVPGNTASAPFNSPTVDILLTTNASISLETFNATTPTSPNATTWTTIASGVPNNGTYTVTLPDVATTKTACRFMVKAVGNVFLAVNSKNFTITPATASSDEFGFTNFSIYPNPNRGNFNVKFDSTSNNEISIVVNDIRGRNIFEKQFSNTGLIEQNIQLSNVSAGIYLVTVKDGDQKIVKRIVIE
ncbi:reprolysin-like metallopeptidase [Flavobacterium sp.]|jgi:hypothetical protein|uniref:zinc-dependent metalloprotease n=1 Tax=Flavobacterium sp. TaxID=239 RepID=UPI0037BF3598